jgi:hypothetical protein
LLAKKSAVDQSGNLRNALDLPTFHHFHFKKMRPARLERATFSSGG